MTHRSLSFESKPTVGVINCVVFSLVPRVPLVSNRQTFLNTTTNPLLQPKLKISAPNDKYEQEADKVAEQVMGSEGTALGVRAPPYRAFRTSFSLPRIQRMCPHCEDEAERESLEKQGYGGIVQTKTAAGHAPALSVATSARIQSFADAGQPLPGSERAFFELRFGHNFSQVRIHTDTHAAELANSVQAKAFTLGKNIVFNRGQYRPQNLDGRMLIAHELAHYVQQNGNASRIQRKLQVGGPEDKEDPAAKMSADERNKMIEKLIKELGEGFKVTPTSGSGDVSGEVVPDTADCTKAGVIASSSKGVGSCCLCVLTRAGARTWTIRIVTERGASTNFGTGTINIPASSSPAVSGHWTQADVRRMRPRVITLAHEICGHAALFEVQAHPSGSRIRGTRHDPTIRVEQAIWGEQGLPSAEERGLASSPVHRGESFTRIVVQNFRFGSADLKYLPSGERKKIALAAKLAFLVNPSPPPKNFNNRYVDIIGHADKPTKSAAANKTISEDRATNVKNQMVKLGVPLNIEVTADKRPFLDASFHSKSGSVARYTNVKGVSSSACKSSGRDPACRKVEIFIASFPAGAAKPPPGTPGGPSTLAPVSPRNPAAALHSFRTGDACVKLLIKKAWTP